MSNSPADDERLDHDQTDELPILLDAADHGRDEERTGETTSHLVELSPSDDPARSLENELEQRIKQIATLERDLARLSARWLDTERYLTEKDAVIRDLNRALAKTRVETSERRATEQRLATELQDREAQFNKLLDELDKQRQQSAAAEREVEHQRAGRQATVEELALARLELAQRSSPITEDDEIRALREELATLSVYIDNRHDSWVSAEARAADQQQRIAELERELAQRAERQQRAEELAERETSRAVALREDLVAQSRRAESLATELEQFRSYPDAQRAAIAGLEGELATAWQAHERLQQELAEAREALVRRDVALHAQSRGDSVPLPAARAVTIASMGSVPDPATQTTAIRHARILSDTPSISAGSSALTARHGSDVELKHETQHEAARALARPTAATASQGETKLRRAEARAEIDDADTIPVERAVADKDRGVAALDERGATPQAERFEKHTTKILDAEIDPASKRLESKSSQRSRRSEVSIDTANTPTLICLTSDGPRQYALSKRVTTIGRSAHCDIQIVTHFVSREHARISVTQRGDVTIEDLASTNGVFVNSVRVERQELRHGDLVTVGETQFRFLESMAH